MSEAPDPDAPRGSGMQTFTSDTAQLMIEIVDGEEVLAGIVLEREEALKFAGRIIRDFSQ